jgi:hypothetical protein
VKHIASVALVVGLTASLGCRGQVELSSGPPPGPDAGIENSPDSSIVINTSPDATGVVVIPESSDATAPVPSLDATLIVDNGQDASPPFNKALACAEAPTAVIPYATASDLTALIVGQWVRCEGVLQPQNGLPAPDRQDGLQFESGGGVDGLVSSELPLPEGGTGYLPYIGGTYGIIDWQFWPTDAGAPGVLFESSGGSYGFEDTPVFSNGGNRMVLSDAVWPGTYVRF